MMGIISIAAVDDHPIILDSVAGWVMADEGDIRVAATAPTVEVLLAGPGRHADVVLLDLDLGDGTTVRGNVTAIAAAGPAVLVLSASDQPIAVRAAMHAGARGYALKSERASQIRAAIREVAAGRDWISPRLAYIFATDEAPDRPALSIQETRALQLYATGMPLKSVARKMTISEETVKAYLGRVRQKYANVGRAAPTKLELYHRAVEDGHLSPPSLVRCPPAGKKFCYPLQQIRSHEIPALGRLTEITYCRPVALSCHPFWGHGPMLLAWEVTMKSQAIAGPRCLSPVMSCPEERPERPERSGHPRYVPATAARRR